jgi:hypothetical protein
MRPMMSVDSSKVAFMFALPPIREGRKSAQKQRKSLRQWGLIPDSQSADRAGMGRVGAVRWGKPPGRAVVPIKRAGSAWSLVSTFACRASASRVDIGYRLPVGVPDDVADGHRVGVPRRGEAAGDGAVPLIEPHKVNVASSTLRPPGAPRREPCRPPRRYGPPMN